MYNYDNNIQLDIIILMDFSKAFDKVLYQPLLCI